MRLTTKIATAGEREGLAQFPAISTPMSEIFTAEGVMDYAKALEAIKKSSGIMTSADDDKATVAFAFEFLDRIKMSFSNLAERLNDNITIERTDEKKPLSQRSSSEKRMRKGLHAFVRVDIRMQQNIVRVSLSWSNPKDVVGHAEELAEIIAMGYAKNLVAIREDLKKENPVEVRLVEGENCEGIFKEAERRIKIDEAFAKREKCEHRVGDFCQGIHDCLCRKNGRCVAPSYIFGV